MCLINETHSSELLSWVESANHRESDFPIQNLPFAIFRPAGSDEVFRGGVAIGDKILDMAAVLETGLVSESVYPAAEAASRPKLNQLMAMGAKANSALRKRLSELLRIDNADQDLLRKCLISQEDAEFDLPCQIGDYTDFYSSLNHATAVGKLFRPEQPLFPNYKWLPVGYHGRSSSIGISGQKVVRPRGQVRDPNSENSPVFSASQRLDYELEVGIFIGPGNLPGEPIPLDQAEQHIFGFCLLNDWSARDIQAWEYQPLGPFLGKNFASTISPWVVTLEALAPFRSELNRDENDPKNLPYLDSEFNSRQGGFDIQLEVLIETERMQNTGMAPVRLSQTSFRHSYWTAAQMVSHHSVNGCNLNPGDLFGSGTQSGIKPNEAGSLLELTKGGKRYIDLPNGEQRAFLEDFDRVIMKAYCQNGSNRIGFGRLISQVLPAKPA